MTNFGQILREIREEKNMTCVKLSKITGISVRNLYRWEKGETTPRFYEDISKIAKALKVPEEIFLRNDVLSQRIKGLEENVAFLQEKVKSLETQLTSLGIID